MPTKSPDKVDALPPAGPVLDQSRTLLSGRLLARNTLWNLVGNGAPVIVAVFSMPILIRGLGKDRFGVLALAWALIGYAGLFDLGVGRALTQLVAKKLGCGEEREVPSLAWTSLLLMLLLGVLGAVVVMVISPWLVQHALKVPGALQVETLRSFNLLALSLPVVITTTGLRGLLEAHQRFALANALRIPMGVFTFVGPLLVLPFSRTLVPVIAVLVLGRVLGCAGHLWACFRVMPALRREASFDWSSIPPLLSFGGWMTVNNVVGPLMLYVDRFVIGSILSIAAVAYYTAPVDIVLRLVIIPSAVVGVLFPAFATSLHREPDRSALLLARGLKYVFLAMFPVVLFLVSFAHETLRLWLGPAFEHEGAVVLSLAAAGIFVNSLSTVPFVLIQSAGRPDLTAWLLVAELPVYSVLLWSMTRWKGIDGTAMAWAIRLLGEAACVFFLSYRLLPHKPKLLLGLCTALTAGLGILYLATLPQNPASRTMFFVATSLCSAIAAWFWGLTPAERQPWKRIPAELPVQVHAD